MNDLFNCQNLNMFTLMILQLWNNKRIARWIELMKISNFEYFFNRILPFSCAFARGRNDEKEHTCMTQFQWLYRLWWRVIIIMLLLDNNVLLLYNNALLLYNNALLLYNNAL